MTTILAGAYLANTAGLATFDNQRLIQCLAAALRDMRGSCVSQRSTA